LKIVRDYPPNILAIDAHFHTMGKPILYAYGDAIYNPQGIHVDDSLLAHEAVHMMHQAKDGPEPWWQKYIEDQEYRYAEELAAHKVEFAVVASQIADRNARAKLLMAIAAKLVAPLYGYSGKRLLQAQKDLMC
jgi:hypothetical protein